MEIMKIDDICKFMEALPDASLLIDANGQILSCNTQATIRLKYSKEKLTQLTVEALVPERYRKAHKGLRESFVMSSSQRAMGGEAVSYFPARLADGSEIMTEISIGRLKVEEDDTNVLLVILIDRTDKVKLEEELKRRANIDQLTELYSRPYFIELLNIEFDRAKRYKRPYSIVYFDVDKFKNINDVYGHYVGDLVLRQLGEQCKKSLRSMDICGRLGGEEFVAILPETALDTACLVAERLRKELSNLEVPAKQDNIAFSASFGVTIVDIDNDTSSIDALKRADDALYKAKENGRNQVVCGTL